MSDLALAVNIMQTNVEQAKEIKRLRAELAISREETQEARRQTVELVKMIRTESAYLEQRAEGFL